LKKFPNFSIAIESDNNFCGRSTYGKCNIDEDCIVSGCSNEVCQSKFEEKIFTTCIFRDCYNASKYNLSCKCINGKCQWRKNECARLEAKEFPLSEIRVVPIKLTSRMLVFEIYYQKVGEATINKIDISGKVNRDSVSIEDITLTSSNFLQNSL